MSDQKLYLIYGGAVDDLRDPRMAVLQVIRITPNTANLHLGHQKRNLVKQAGGIDINARMTRFS